jgi:hypothetical protein
VLAVSDPINLKVDPHEVLPHGATQTGANGLAVELTEICEPEDLSGMLDLGERRSQLGEARPVKRKR